MLIDRDMCSGSTFCRRNWFIISAITKSVKALSLELSTFQNHSMERRQEFTSWQVIRNLGNKVAHKTIEKYVT